MPFDSAGFPPTPPTPKRTPPGDGLVTALIVVVTVLLLGTPLTLASCSDIVRYAQGR